MSESYKGMPLLSTLPQISSSALDQERFQYDLAEIRQQLSSPKGDGTFQEMPSFANSVSVRLRRLLRLYHETTTDLAGPCPTRDIAQLMAWTRQAGDAVCPRYLVGSKIQEHGELFDLFIQCSVLLVVFLEDIGETIQRETLQPLREEIDRIALARLSGNSAPSTPLPATDQRYAEGVESSFDLLFDVLDRLAGDSIDEQIGHIRCQLHLCLGEMVEMQTFSRLYDAMIKGRRSQFRAKLLKNHKIQTFTRGTPLDRITFVRQNQSNIFMRFMLHSSFLQRWASLSSGDKSRFSFPQLLRNVDRLGLGIEALGNVGNDIATFFRELRENFVSNSLLAEALYRKLITPEQIVAALEVFSQELIPRERQTEVTDRLASSVFSGQFGLQKMQLFADYPQAGPVLELVGVLYEQGIFHGAVRQWQADFLGLRRSCARLNISRFLDLPDFWQRQYRFFRQNLEASHLI